MIDLFGIRPATVNDVSAIAAIEESSRPWAPQYAPDVYRQLVGGQQSLPVRRRLLVSEAGGRVTGFAVASMLHAVHPAEAELESLAVAPGARGRGVGEALLRVAITWAAGAGVFRLEVRSRNESAIRLYRRCGFEDVAVRSGYYTHPADDALCMQLRRSPPAL